MQLPSLQQVKELRLSEGEAFVACGGFEDRAVELPRLVAPPGDRQATAIVLKYRPHDKRNRLQEVCDQLSHKSLAVVPLTYHRHEPGPFDSSLAQALDTAQARSVCLDISGMSRLAIIIAMDVVREQNLPLRLVYAEAETYGPSREEFEEAKANERQHLPTSFIYTGVHDVVRVARLSSVRMQSHAPVLIAFDSFNEALCQALVNVINPCRFLLINGRPPREELRWREDATAYVHRRLRQEWSVEHDNDPPKTTSTLWYEETYALLAELYWRFSAHHRIILAPTGSKLQTVSSYLLRAVHSDIHIEYPVVGGFFSDRYSSGVHATWQLSFGRMGDFVDGLRAQDLWTNLRLPKEPVDVDIP
ncbi:hypothetical protein ACFL09_06415 [Planctomycetota bacterium]